MHRRFILVTSLLCLLAGCFTSSRPLFTEATAEAPLETGHYTSYACENSTCDTAEGAFDINLQGKRYTVVDSDNKTSLLTLHPHGEHQFIAQMTSSTPQGKPAYDYLLLRMQKGEMLLYAANCKAQDAAKLTALGVVVETSPGGFIGDSVTCRLDGVKDAQALFATVNWGEPMLKLVRTSATAP